MVKLLLQVDMNCSPPRFPSRLLGYFLTSGVANLGRIFKFVLVMSDMRPCCLRMIRHRSMEGFL